MKCDSCESGRATQHITVFEEGIPREFHLCGPCAREKNAIGPGAWLARLRPPDAGEARKAVTCPVCSHENLRGWKFCSECGARRGP